MCPSIHAQSFKNKSPWWGLSSVIHPSPSLCHPSPSLLLQDLFFLCQLLWHLGTCQTITERPQAPWGSTTFVLCSLNVFDSVTFRPKGHRHTPGSSPSAQEAYGVHLHDHHYLSTAWEGIPHLIFTFQSGREKDELTRNPAMQSIQSQGVWRKNTK